MNLIWIEENNIVKAQGEYGWEFTIYYNNSFKAQGYSELFYKHEQLPKSIIQNHYNMNMAKSAAEAFNRALIAYSDYKLKDIQYTRD